jgi:hypothetical protein
MAVERDRLVASWTVARGFGASGLYAPRGSGAAAFLACLGDPCPGHRAVRPAGGGLRPALLVSNPLDDSAPTLALTPGSTFPLTLISVRGGSATGPEPPSDLRRGLGNASGTWSSSTLATLGFLNAWPDARVVGTTTYLTWIRDDRAMAADNQSGQFVSHRFNTPAIPHGRPRVGVWAGIVFAGWITTVNRTFVAARAGGVWSGAYASPAGLPRPQLLVGLAPNAGKATALNISITSRLYATNET